MMRSRRGPVLAVLAAALLALAAPAARAQHHASTHQSMTVVTLNLWHDQADWPRRMARILSELRAMNADVICLQEVLQHATLPNQAQALGDSLGYHVFFASVDTAGSPKRYGNAILTRHRVLAEEARNLQPLDDYRVAAHVRIEVDGHAVDVYDTHLHHTREGAAIRATQVRDLLDFIAATRGGGVVLLAGDFNAPYEADELALLRERFADAFLVSNPGVSPADAATMNPRFEKDPRAIDHIFFERAVRPALYPLESEVLFRSVGPDSVWASDHFGVTARMRVRH